MNPLAIDLFCGLGGWTEGLLEEGYEVVGFHSKREAQSEADRLQKKANKTKAGSDPGSREHLAAGHAAS